ncbi:LacI family DNA-binding transcriptional regulator [Ostreiculturibacter nitratireducens]|uniref:LacI family DNA-binding transcriptional regulator n=1 Tax=Ostreiculturibacter nitratireducens TaxID=3075226 RepID=UPI0031B56ABB
MARRPTIADVAREAGVSVATVDRVLNGRERVREDTARRVYEAAREVGYHAAALIEQRLKIEMPEIRMGFVLHKERQAFYQSFAREIAAAAKSASGVRTQLQIDFSASQSPSETAELLLAMADKAEVVAATAVNHPAITAAVSELKARGIPCFALLSDFAQGVREGYIGLNNLKVGRVSAWMIATAARGPGKVALFVGGHRWHGHELREAGFRSYFREAAPQFEVLDTLVNLETRQLTYEATLDMLRRHPTVRGIYIAGGGMEGAIAAVREAREPGEVVLIVNELTPESSAGLADGFVTMVNGTPLPELCRELVGQMIRVAGAGPSDLPGQVFMKQDIYLPESM